MNTKDDLDHIQKHIHLIPSFVDTPLLVWINCIRQKLDLYLVKIEELKEQIEEKDRAIQRLIEKG